MSLTRALDAGIRLPTSVPAIVEGARVALYPLCSRFAALKQRRREWWWSYL